MMRLSAALLRSASSVMIGKSLSTRGRGEVGGTCLWWGLGSTSRQGLVATEVDEDRRGSSEVAKGQQGWREAARERSGVVRVAG